MPPLNGSKIHPLSPHALEELRDLVRRPAPRQQINAGVAARLETEGLVEIYEDVSPYATHRGGKIPFLRATAAGRERVA